MKDDKGFYASQLAFKLPTIIQALIRENQQTTIGEIAKEVGKQYQVENNRSLRQRIWVIVRQQINDGNLISEKGKHPVTRVPMIIIKNIK